MKNIQLRSRTRTDIDDQVAKVLRGLGNPEPPLDLRLVRELLKLDLAYYSTTANDGLLRETVSRLKVAGKQILQRPSLLVDAVQKLSLKALYLPDQKRILLDETLPKLKHRWNEAHEVGHSLIPWHDGMMLGDTEQTLTPACHAAMEAEANYAAGQILFLQERFPDEGNACMPSFSQVQRLHKIFGNTLTSTLWRYVEQIHPDIPMVGLVSGHPHPEKRKPDFDLTNPCKYFIQSKEFAARFGILTEQSLFTLIASYCRPQKAGPIGDGEIILTDGNGGRHQFYFETFFNGYDALTLGVWRHACDTIVPMSTRYPP